MIQEIAPSIQELYLSQETCVSGECSQSAANKACDEFQHTIGCTRITRTQSLLNYLELISVLITLTLTLLIVLRINFKSVIGIVLGTKYPGCAKEICLSPPLPFDVPPLGLHLHSGSYTYTLKLFWN